MYLSTVACHGLRDKDNHQLCGFDPSQEFYLVDEARSVGLDETVRRRHRRHRHRQLTLNNCEGLCDQCIEIETRVHLVKAKHGTWTVIPHPTAAYEQLLSNDTDTSLFETNFSTLEDIQALFQDNVQVLNQAFRGTPFRFRFNATASQSIVHTEWTNYASEFRLDIYNALASRNPRILDVFLVHQMLDRTTGTQSTAMASFAGEQLENEGVVMRFNASIYYSNARYLQDRAMAAVHNSEQDDIHSLILDCNPINDIDTAGVKMLLELRRDLKKENVTLYLAVCKAAVTCQSET